MKKNDPRMSEFTHTKKGELDDTQWMKKDWNKRAEEDAYFFVVTSDIKNEKKFWDSYGIRNKILSMNTPIYSTIIGNKIPKNMRILEIGCGIGRIMSTMSEIFGEVIGVDVSKKMIEIAKEKMSKFQNCKVYENNGNDLSMFPENYFDFCYSVIVFQHVPNKEIVSNYIKETGRILKPDSIFRFQVYGDVLPKKGTPNTWVGVSFNQKEIHKIAKENNFEILEEEGEKTVQYWLTFKLKH